jgi:toxin ParE1/3/4
VSTLRFSQLAESDLLSIARYTLGEWGAAQTARYLTRLEQHCERLAENPMLGRSCAGIRPGLRRSEYGRHVIFYRAEENGILISRVLHARMLPDEHVIDPSEQI